MNKQQRKKASLLAWALGLITLMVFCNTAAATVNPDPLAKPDAAAQARLVETYGKLPLSFEANQGQTDKTAQFLSRGQGYGLFLTRGGAVAASIRVGQHEKKQVFGTGIAASRRKDVQKCR
ncbi:MAG: hypothetical protein EPN89_09370 [Methylovulum sp.]|nr:MAG: hypothetical protein EPN89_09370 [Methylovulum sp.]